MQQKNSSPNQLVPEPLFRTTAAECFLLFQQYRLKTHIVGSNIEKDILYQCYDSLEGRIIDRYTKMYEQLQRALKDLERNFTLAKASSLRVVNNILRNYRRRIGTLSNQPLSNFKYNKYDKYEKMLMQCLIYTDRDNYLQLLQFKEELTFSIEQGEKEIDQKYKSTDKIKDSYKRMMEVVDKTQCFCYKYYENFERSMITTINSLQAYFQKLNTYLTVWENVGSTKAYEIKSQKQRQMQQRTNDGLFSRKFFEEETEEHLEQLYKNCPVRSSLKEEYRKKLNEIRKYNAQKDKKLDMIGKMFNKRKNRAGILVSRYRDLSILDWYFNIEGNRANMYADEFRHYNADIDNNHNQYKPTGYELQKPFKKDKVEDIKQHLQKYQGKSTLNHQWRYDKYGKDGVFDLIDCGNHLVQKRIEFQITRQIELQNSDDRRKRELLQRQNFYTREVQRKEGLHIGFIHFQQGQEIQWLQDRDYDTQYLPELIDQRQEESFSFSDQQEEPFDQQEKNAQLQQQGQPKKQNQPLVQEIKKTQPLLKEVKKQPLEEREMAPLVKQGNQKRQPIQATEKPQEQIVKEEEEEDYRQLQDMCLQEQIITSYFREFSFKVLRKESEPLYKQTKFFYFPTLEQISWDKISRHFECEKIFISTQNSVIYLNHIFSSHQKIKGSVYTLDQDLQEDVVRQKISTCFAEKALVTIKFFPIYTELDSERLTPFMIGLLLVLVNQNEMPQDYQIKDYIQKGKEIIQDYNCYYYPEQYKTSIGIYMRHNQNVAPQAFSKKKKQPNGTQQTLATEEIQSLSSKNASTIHSNQPHHQAIIQKKQEQELDKQNKFKKYQNTAPTLQNEVLLNSQASYQGYEQQRQLKRQNSREFLRKEEIELSLAAHQLQVQKDEAGQQDYQSL